MNQRQPIDITDVNNLTLNIYTIGYPTEGETILTTICEKGRPVFTIVTDCYNDMGCHAVNRLLSSLENPHVDVFIWTHPHDDHSKGIVKLLERNDPRHTAQIFLPDGIMACHTHILSEETRYTLNYLQNNYNKGIVYNMCYIGVFANESRTFKWELRQRNNELTLKCLLSFMAPMSTVEARRFYCDDNTRFNLNDLSIVYSLDLNDTNYIFGGDLRNQNVQFINEDSLMNVKFIKIPHHGSTEPMKFLKLLQKNNVKATVATTTVFKKKDLPQTETVTEYKKVASRILSTGLDNGYRIGCIRYRTSIVDTSFPQVKTIGNAVTL